jgi:hypothetical protein
VIVVASYLLPGGAAAFGFGSLVAVAAAFLFVATASADRGLASVLAGRPAVYIGKLSYSLYLWHWPAIVFAKEIFVGHETLASGIALIVSFAIAVVIYNAIECPMRHSTGPYRFVSAQLAGVLLLAGIVGFLGTARRYDGGFRPVHFYGLVYDVTPKVDPVTWETAMKRVNVVAPSRPSEHEEAFRNDGIPGGALDGRPEVVVIGDSHGSMWGRVIDRACRESGYSVAFFTTVGSRPIFRLPINPADPAQRGFSSSQSLQFRENLVRKLDAWRPAVVVLGFRWSSVEPAEIVRLGTLVDFCSVRGIDVVVIGQPPEIAVGNHNAAQYLAYRGYRSVDGDIYLPMQMPERYRLSQHRIREASEQWQAEYLDLTPLYVRNEMALAIRGDQVLYYDDDHLSEFGASLAFDPIKSTLAKHLAGAASSAAEVEAR